jgi:CheY-like chemotaxis protein
MEALRHAHDLRRNSVLLVEDEPVLRSLLAEELSDAGFAVVEAANADEALAFLQANPRVDLVFTDVQMPGSMNGVELAAILRERYPVLAIILTSASMPARAARDLGIFIPKPYKLADARALVFNTLGGATRAEIR